MTAESDRRGDDRVTVIGGTGRTGRRVVTGLAEMGIEVRVVSRRPAPATQLPPGVEHVQGDLAALDPALLEVPSAVIVSVEPPAEAAGADAVAHRGVAVLARLAAANQVPVILISQIYITRPEAYPQMRDIILARGRGEDALRASGAPYVIIRPGWLTDAPAQGVRLEQGDTGDGQVSRDAVAAAAAAAAVTAAGHGRTFEIFDAEPPTNDPVDWASALSAMTPDRTELAHG